MLDQKGDIQNGTLVAVFERRMEENPIPVELVNVCSGDYPVYIVAVPGTLTTAHRGSPVAFNSRELFIPLPTEYESFLEFCAEHKIEGRTSWYLSSYWG